MSNSFFNHTGFISAGNMAFIEGLYKQYKQDRTTVDASWYSFFQILDDNQGVISHDFSLMAQMLIEAYRSKGYRAANLDPLNLRVLQSKKRLGLRLEDFGFTDDKSINLHKPFLGNTTYKAGSLRECLEQIYCDSISVEFEHVDDEKEKNWLYNNYEEVVTTFNCEDQEKALERILGVEEFEQFIHRRFPGAKRFSSNGSETSVVGLQHLIEIAFSHGIEQVIVGMAHRARLAVLTEVFKKSYHSILKEFANKNAAMPDSYVSGDVKYHVGYRSEYRDDVNNKVYLELLANPSHLESVNSVLAGTVRARQDKTQNKQSVLGVLLHGDTAFSGQGVVTEALMMSKLTPYDVGGVIHIIIDNQLGFTATPCETRYCGYATEVAKIIGAPIIHVNGDNLEKVMAAIEFSHKYRQEFSKDVIINIICYRKYGHNEGDEPNYTQPKMYQAIKSKISPANIYNKYLIEKGLIATEAFSKIKKKAQNTLEQAFLDIDKDISYPMLDNALWKNYFSYHDKEAAQQVKTGVNIDELLKMGLKLCEVPKDFSLHSKLFKIFEHRKQELQKGKIDWATAEQLAMASLLLEGSNIRLTGQDSQRGTFSHRHSVLHDQENGKLYIPLNHITKTQGQYYAANSNLSEYAVLGFEYGHSLVDPKNLTMWEAQFGDFANGAQIMFDQFISSAESKWKQKSGLVVLLPHGYEGQGPEHSSARLERFLQLAAQNNMQIANPTTPASYFHLLRRQIVANYRLPLIIMTPKSLLRHKLVISDIRDFAPEKEFSSVIDDNSVVKNDIKSLVICSGKVYYDLLEERNSKGKYNIALARIEEYYPWPEKKLLALIKSYNNISKIVWCQEEPKNMGAWSFVYQRLTELLNSNKIKLLLLYVGRDESASPATGYSTVHIMQQEQIVKEALEI